ncbi:hypothetical protein QTO34_011706 [Cnephaeus nilssonii]|uniref:Retroviral nucleocapsid Gag protein p24 C-terminal domain-containing protein n=1 Tax=Cnephaeus nilssonii TaxID=3371016 RepID=A0AA40HDZ2_CNENI|nr:hypothetical protein QTO34_011706 [Eptesicus nilssonii]
MPGFFTSRNDGQSARSLAKLCPNRREGRRARPGSVPRGSVTPSPQRHVPSRLETELLCSRFNRQAGPDNWRLNRSLRTWDTEGEELLRKKECTRKGKKEKQCTVTKKGSKKDDDTGVVQAKEEEEYSSAGTEEGSDVEDVLEQFLEGLKRLGKEKRSRGGRSRRSPLPCAAPVPLSPLQMALQEARKAGEDLGIHAFPVMERVNPNTGQRERTYDPLPFKTLKELKTACAQYGPTSPYTLTILETIASEALPPNDWRAIAKGCLSGGDYLLWKSEYDEKAKEQAARNRAAQINISYEMLTGEGDYADTHNQIQYPLEAYGQINGAGIRAWKKLPTSGQKTEELSKIIQGPDEKYQDFVSRLLQAVGRVVVDGEAGMLIVKQLAYENANGACQAALRPYQRKGTLSDYIRICADIGPSYIQGVAIAAALKGTTIEGILQQQFSTGRGPRSAHLTIGILIAVVSNPGAGAFI